LIVLVTHSSTDGFSWRMVAVWRKYVTFVCVTEAILLYRRFVPVSYSRDVSIFGDDDCILTSHTNEILRRTVMR
jgi:hypothetical protein